MDYWVSGGLKFYLHEGNGAIIIEFTVSGICFEKLLDYYLNLWGDLDEFLTIFTFGCDFGFIFLPIILVYDLWTI